MLQMLQSQNYGLQQLTKLEGSMCIQKPWKERMKNNSKPHHYILSPNPSRQQALSSLHFQTLATTIQPNLTTIRMWILFILLMNL
jgi:hypothetical protein